MNLVRLVRYLQAAFYALRLGQLLGLGKPVRRIRHYLAHHRITPFWAVALLSFAVPWGWYWWADERAAAAGDLCAVNRVVDGDGVRLNCGPGREDLNVRLYCIDAPETEQAPWGDLSTEHLARIAGDRVQLVDHGTGRWGRTIGQLISPEGVDLNRRMVADGWAPVYPQFCDEPAYYRAERGARALGLGIWAEPGMHQRPWEWR